MISIEMLFYHKSDIQWLIKKEYAPDKINAEQHCQFESEMRKQKKSHLPNCLNLDWDMSLHVWKWWKKKGSIFLWTCRLPLLHNIQNWFFVYLKIDHYDPRNIKIRQVKKSSKLEHIHIVQVKLLFIFTWATRSPLNYRHYRISETTKDNHGNFDRNR